MFNLIIKPSPKLGTCIVHLSIDGQYLEFPYSEFGMIAFMRKAKRDLNMNDEALEHLKEMVEIVVSEM